MPNASPWTLAAIVAGGGIGTTLLLMLVFPNSDAPFIGVGLTIMFSVNVFMWRRKQIRDTPGST